MILNSTPESQAIVSNVISNSDFKIKASAKAFSILSSGLYSNKIKAIIQELSCNAYDSHVAAGKKDVPFDVFLPSILEPSFYIRDYGVGLSDEEVNNVYTTYFESTKTKSNDYVGALGLGSKTPFCYTDNFTVTAWKNGVCRIYTAYINDLGCPSIVKLSECDSDEPTGVKVEFSLKDKRDNVTFIDEAARVYKYFDILPNFINENIIPSHDNVLYKDFIPGTDIIDLYNSYNSPKCLAVMGNICYPIEIPSSFIIPDDIAWLFKLHLNQFKIRFNIGELDFQASREGLSYNKHTIESIYSKFREILSKITEKFQEEVKTINLNDIWEYCDIISKLSKISLWSVPLSNYIKLNWNKTGLTCYSYPNSGYSRISYPVITYPVIKIDYSKLETEKNIKKSSGKNNTKSQDFSYDPQFRNNLKIYVNDANYSIKHIRSYHNTITKNHHINSAVILSKNNKKESVDFESYINETFNNPPSNMIIYTSTIPEPEGKETRKLIKYHTYYRIPNCYRSNNQYQYKWRPSTKEELGGKCYWIHIKKFNAIFYNKECNPNLLIEMMKMVRIDKLIGVRTSELKNVDPNWINFQDLVEKMLNDEAVLFNSKYRVFENHMQSYSRSFNFKIEDQTYKVDADSCIKKFYDKYIEFFKFQNKSKNNISNINEFSYTMLKAIFPEPEKKLSEYIHELETDILEIFKVYPMLEFINSNIKTATITEYIKMVDSIKGEK
jgi:hypothetical protein